MLPKPSSSQCAECYQGNAEELRAVRVMTSQLITRHKVSVKIFLVKFFSNFLLDLVNEGKHMLIKSQWGANQAHVQLNTHFKTGSKQSLARRPQRHHSPQPTISGAIFMFPVSCSADERSRDPAGVRTSVSS